MLHAACDHCVCCVCRVAMGDVMVTSTWRRWYSALPFCIRTCCGLRFRKTSARMRRSDLIYFTLELFTLLSFLDLFISIPCRYTQCKFSTLCKHISIHKQSSVHSVTMPVYKTWVVKPYLYIQRVLSPCVYIIGFWYYNFTSKIWTWRRVFIDGSLCPWNGPNLFSSWRYLNCCMTDPHMPQTTKHNIKQHMPLHWAHVPKLSS